MIDFLVHHQNVTIPTNFQCFNPQILMVSPFFRMFSPLFQTPSSFQFFPPFSDHFPTPKVPPACDVPRRGSHLLWPLTSTGLVWTRKNGPISPGKMGALPEQMVDFTNFKIEMLTFAKFHDEKLGENGNWSIKWWMNHMTIYVIHGDIHGYTYSQHLSTN